MSDIAMPPGFTLTVFSVGGLALSLTLMLLSLSLNLFIQRGLPFRRRVPFQIMLGMLLPLTLSALGLLFAGQGPREWLRASEHLNELYYIALYLFSVVAGILLVFWKGR